MLLKASLSDGTGNTPQFLSRPGCAVSPAFWLWWPLGPSVRSFWILALIPILPAKLALYAQIYLPNLPFQNINVWKRKISRFTKLVLLSRKKICKKKKLCTEIMFAIHTAYAELQSEVCHGNEHMLGTTGLSLYLKTVQERNTWRINMHCK